MTGDPLPDILLFLSASRSVDVPLEATDQAAWRGVPGMWKRAIEGRA